MTNLQFCIFDSLSLCLQFAPKKPIGKSIIKIHKTNPRGTAKFGSNCWGCWSVLEFPLFRAWNLTGLLFCKISGSDRKVLSWRKLKMMKSMKLCLILPPVTRDSILTNSNSGGTCFIRYSRGWASWNPTFGLIDAKNYAGWGIGLRKKSSGVASIRLNWEWMNLINPLAQFREQWIKGSENS